MVVGHPLNVSRVPVKMAPLCNPPADLAISATVCNSQNKFSCKLPTYPNLDALDCSQGVVYVSNINSTVSPNGTMAKPWQSLSLGIEDAVAKDARLIVATNTKLYEEETLAVRSGISIIGGYDETWTYAPEQKTKILISATLQDEEELIGLEAREIRKPTLIANLNVETANNTGRSNNYGIYASAANLLTLDNLTILTGNGGAGSTATTEPSLRGRDGADGLPGQLDPNQVKASYDCAPAYPVPLEPGFYFTCEHVDLYGGSGGSGGCVGMAPTTGKSSAKNVGGGEAGSTNSPSGERGNDAQPWGRDFWGDPGKGGTPGQAVTNGKLYSLGAGGDGTPGKLGKGGGGGGASYREVPYASGPSGGNGGNGGCGGAGGHGGEPGGTSIGIFIVDSFGLEIRGDTSVQAGHGGIGGTGGMGGTGGRGGKGGKGSNQACDVTTPKPMFPYARDFDNCQTLGYKSGDGGDGADGTPGGPGGGGAGGDSYGIYCHASRISLHPSTTAKAGEPGQGGMGGAYPVPDEPVMGEQGEPGISSDIVGCN